MHLNTTRKYLAKGEYYTFKPRKKPFLKPEYKKVRFLWVHLMKDHSFEDWALFAFSDEATFEIGLDTRLAWVHRKICTAYESKNLKLTFKSRHSTIGI
jgi:hypothetical protein